MLHDRIIGSSAAVEVARQIHQKAPALPILFVTGYADKTALADVGEERIIKKPFIGDELTTKVNTALVKGARRFSDKVVVPLRR